MDETGLHLPPSPVVGTFERRTSRARAIKLADRIGRELRDDMKSHKIEADQRGSKFAVAVYAVAEQFEDDPEALNDFIDGRIEAGGGKVTAPSKYQHQPLVRAFVAPESWADSKSSMTRYAQAIEGLKLNGIPAKSALAWMETEDPHLPGTGLAKAVAAYKRHPFIKAEAAGQRDSATRRDLSLLDSIRANSQPLTDDQLKGCEFGLAFLEIDEDTGQHRVLRVYDNVRRTKAELRYIAKVVRKLWPEVQDEE